MKRLRVAITFLIGGLLVFALTLHDAGNSPLPMIGIGLVIVGALMLIRTKSARHPSDKNEACATPTPWPSDAQGTTFMTGGRKILVCRVGSQRVEVRNLDGLQLSRLMQIVRNKLGNSKEPTDAPAYFCHGGFADGACNLAYVLTGKCEKPTIDTIEGAIKEAVLTL